MVRKFFSLALVIAFATTVSFAQENASVNYFSNEKVDITSHAVDCHYPENGIHSEYVFLKITNKTNEELAINFKLDTWYNYGKSTPDVSDYAFTIPANGTLEGTCADRVAGLSIYSKILDLPAKSTLMKYELNNLKLNGELAK